MNGAVAILMLLYFAVSVVLGVGGWLYRRRLAPTDLYRWVPRQQLLWVVITAATFIAFAILIDLWPLALLMLPLALYGVYYVTALARVCEACGTAVPSLSLSRPARYCLKCGAPLRKSTLLGE